jgi:hypothetical protein
MVSDGEFEIKGTKFRFQDGSSTIWEYEGDVVNSNPSGNLRDIGIDGEHLVYIDENGEKRQLPRRLHGAVAGTRGSLWVENGLVTYVDKTNQNKADAFIDEQTYTDSGHDNANHDDGHDNHSNSSHYDTHQDETTHDNSGHSDKDHVDHQDDHTNSFDGDGNHTNTGHDDSDHVNHQDDHSNHTDYTDSGHDDAAHDDGHDDHANGVHQDDHTNQTIHDDQPTQVA